MVLETVLVELLGAHQPLVDVVSDRIFPERPPIVEIDGVLEFEQPLPLLVFATLDAEDIYDLEGNELDLHYREFAVDIWSRDALENYELRNLVKTALRVRTATVRLVKLQTEAAINDDLGFHGQQIYRMSYKDPA